MRITELRTRAHRASLTRPWGPQVRTLDVIEVELSTDTGTVGTGLSWTPSIGARAVRALLDHDIRDRVIGHDIDDVLWDETWRHLHEAGGGGITTIALAGLDLAAWDARARLAGVGVPDLLGRRREEVAVYGSGVNLHYPLEELVAQAHRWVDAGFSAAKMKVGSADLAEDVDRVAAVREVLGPDRQLMIDANQRWDLPTAVRAMGELARFAPAWIEEPLLADDTAGYAALRREIAVPVALGENTHHLYRIRDLLDAGACDIVQPNVVRVGGITPFLRIAELVQERGATLAPHLLPELSAQLAVVIAPAVWVEQVEDAGLYELGVLATPSPVRVAHGLARVESTPGLGLEFAQEITA